MPLRAVLFDFDGTLVDTTELIYQSMRHAASEVLGYEPPREVLMQYVGQPLQRQMELLDAERAEELAAAYQAHNESYHDHYIREFPGVPEALLRVREAGLRSAVVTSKRRPMVRMAVHAFPELGDLVEHFVTAEDTGLHKPHPDPLLKALELLGGLDPRHACLSGRQAAYIGDSPYDMAAAGAAEMLGVGVSWGAFSEETLRAAGADYVLDNLPDAVELVLKKGRGS